MTTKDERISAAASDKQKAECAAAKARVAELGHCLKHALLREDTANARAEAHEIDAKAAYRQRDEWKAKCEAAESSNRVLRHELSRDMVASGESEAASLRAKLEETKANWETTIHAANAEAASLREHLRVQTAAMAEDLAAARTEAASLRQLSEVYADERDQAWRDLNNAERGLEAARELLIQTTDDGSLTEGWKSRRDVFLSLHPCARESELIALRAELQAEKDRRVEHRQMNQSLNEQVQQLRAELEDTRKESGERQAELFATARLLAAATELLDGVRAALAEAYGLPNRAALREHAWRYLDLVRDILADAPAAPSRAICPHSGEMRTRSDGVEACINCGAAIYAPLIAPAPPTRTDHERAVLEAEEAIPDGTLKWLSSGDVMSTSLQTWSLALIARREAEK